MPHEGFTEREMDVFKELMNLGSANAAGALGQMLNKTVMVSVPYVEVLSINQIAEKMIASYGEESKIVALYFKILGGLSGDILIVLKEESVRHLKELLFRDIGTAIPEIPSEVGVVTMENSAMMEVGNIVANSYLNSLARLTDLTLFPSIPHYGEDLTSAVTDFVLIELAQEADQAIFANTCFEVEGVSISGNLLVIPDRGSLDVILEKIGLPKE